MLQNTDTRSIREVLEDLRVEYAEQGHHHCRPGWLQLKVCPWCGSENFHLGYSLGAGFFNCWRCGGHPAVPTLRKLGAKGDISRTLLGRALESKEWLPIRATKLSSPAWGVLLPAHRRYLRQRGFDPTVLEQVWHIGGIGIAPRLSWRIYIPIIQNGRQVSWTTRAIGDKVSQRYISASASEEVVSHKHTVYGLDYCRHSVVIVEGPIDAWAVGPGAGALFGTAFTTPQVRKLAAIPYRFICFDAQPDAQARARELAAQLSGFPGQTCNVQLDAKDPAEASPNELRRLRRAAKLENGLLVLPCQDLGGTG